MKYLVRIDINIIINTKMANDVANEIVKILENSEMSKGMELQELYRLKVIEDRKKLKNELYEYVSGIIRTRPQPNNTQVELYPAILGAKPVSYERMIPLNDSDRKALDKDVFTCFAYDKYYTITDKNTRNLIEHAIIPLNLKWNINCATYFIKVSWGHWDVK